MKPSWEWTEDDLIWLMHHKVQESIDLQYKACDALQKTDGKKREISKDVSALANSAGGTIVYGLVEQDNLPVRIDVGYDTTDIPREWLEQVINSTIHRRIDGVRINPIELASIRPGRLAYVVYVPQSLHAPHQAADKRFYKRFNFESVPMEEYEIRDVARRASRPEVDLEVSVTDFSFSLKDSTKANVHFRATNRSTATSSFVVLTVGLGWGGSISSPYASS